MIIPSSSNSASEVSLVAKTLGCAKKISLNWTRFLEDLGSSVTATFKNHLVFAG